MKVLVISAFCPHGHADSAGVLDVYHMVRYLSIRHDVSVVCPITEEDEDGLETLTRLARVIGVPGRSIGPRWRYAVVSALSLLGRLPAIAHITDSDSLKEAIRKLLAHEDFDVVHFAFTQTMHLRSLIPDGVPTVIDESDLAFERRRRFAMMIRNPFARILILWDCRKLERYELDWLSKFDGVLLRTQREEELLRSKIKLKHSLVIPPWVDVSFRDRVTPRPTDRTLLFFGALWRPVNDDAALWMAREVFPIVLREIPDVRLALVGSRPSKSVAGLAGPRIDVPGWVDSIAPWYEKSSVVVAPLRAGSGIKGKVIQALGVGRPVVATPIGAEGIDATESDGLFVEADAESFAATIISLLNTRDHLRWYEAGRKYFDRNYSFESGCQAWEALLETLAT